MAEQEPYYSDRSGYIPLPAPAAAPPPPPPPPAGVAQPAVDPLQALYNSIFGGGAGAPAGAPAAGGGMSNILQKLMEAESAYIPEMLSQDYRGTKAGSAAYESAAQPIDARFDQAKEQAMTRFAQQGMTPTSGIVQEQLQEIENQRAQAKSDLERQFNASLPGRQGQGISQLFNLENLSKANQLQSLGVQQSLDEAQRQRYLDAAALGGNQGVRSVEGAAGTAGSLLGAAANLSSMYGGQAANQAQGLGSMLGTIPWGSPTTPTPSNQYATQTNIAPGGVDAVFGPDPYKTSKATGGYGGF
jgi:hypothetical protein